MSSSASAVPLSAWRIHYKLLEPMFFASREIGTVYMCEPLISSYAQPYALGWVSKAPYRVCGEQLQKPNYAHDLMPLNQARQYLTPAAPVEGTIRMRLERFNALGETYWYRMSQGVVVQKITQRSQKVSAVNMPQQGQFRVVCAGSELVAILLAPTLPLIPPYCRLGKFMSKAKVTVTALGEVAARDGEFEATGLVNPADLPEDKLSPIAYEMINVRPVPLLKRARLRGPYWIVQDVTVPRGMAYCS